MRDNQFDIIGDIHGNAQALRDLLTKLGYDLIQFTHPEGRRILFLGDYVDRGPDPLGVLALVRGFVENGSALAIMGNHEFNAVAWHIPRLDGNGFCREHSSYNYDQFQKTLVALDLLPIEEKLDWLKWVQGLPLAIETEEFRAVHACWHPRFIEYYFNHYLNQFLDDAFFQRATLEPKDDNLRDDFPEELTDFWMIETLLKGLETDLPGDMSFVDPNGKERFKARLAWWEDLSANSLGNLMLGVKSKFSAAENQAFHENLESIVDINPSQFGPPIFIGHYWLDPKLLGANSSQLESFELSPLAKNVYCLDYSVAKGGKLVAYRLDQGRAVSVDNF